jgi:hypothetical protein
MTTKKEPDMKEKVYGKDDGFKKVVDYARVVNGTVTDNGICATKKQIIDCIKEGIAWAEKNLFEFEEETHRVGDKFENVHDKKLYVLAQTSSHKVSAFNTDTWNRYIDPCVVHNPMMIVDCELDRILNSLDSDWRKYFRKVEKPK